MRLPKLPTLTWHPRGRLCSRQLDINRIKYFAANINELLIKNISYLYPLPPPASAYISLHFHLFSIHVLILIRTRQKEASLEGVVNSKASYRAWARSTLPWDLLPEGTAWQTCIKLQKAKQDEDRMKTMHSPTMVHWRFPTMIDTDRPSVLNASSGWWLYSQVKAWLKPKPGHLKRENKHDQPNENS